MIPVGTGLAIAGAASAGGGLLSGILGSSASKKAAGQSSQGQIYAAQLAYQMYQQTANRLQPWVDMGGAAAKQLGGFLGLPGQTYQGPGGMTTGAGVTPFPALQPFQPTMAQLEQTPGYQFTKDQGIKGTLNAMGPLGLTKSGAAAKGVESFTTGLASNTFQQQFQNYMQTYQTQFNSYWSQLGQIYNMLSGTSISGANAAAQVGQAGSSTAATAGNFLSGAGQAQGQGTLNAAGSIIQPLNAATSFGGQLALLNATGQFGGSTPVAGGSSGSIVPFTGIPQPSPGQSYPGGFQLPS